VSEDNDRPKPTKSWREIDEMRDRGPAKPKTK
jgi:hypothetical protein